MTTPEGGGYVSRWLRERRDSTTVKSNLAIDEQRLWRLGGWVLVVAIVTRIATLMWHARTWFFTIDDWDYLTRTGFVSVLDPHRRHLTGVAAGAARVLRRIVGLDFWPGYPILISLAWPLVGLAAWWYWRRRKVDPVVATTATLVLIWLATASWIQFGHIGVGVAVAATIVAVHFDSQPFSSRNMLIGAGISVLAVFASTVAALGAIVRLVLALVHRQWNGVAAAGTAVFAWGLWRVGFGQPQDLSFGPSEIPDMIKVVFITVGGGLRLLIPWPEQGAWILGLLFVLSAIALLFIDRFAYRTMVFVGIAAAYLASISVARFIDQPDKLDALFRSGLNLQSVTSTRFANIAIVFVLVAAVGVLGDRILSSRSRSGVLVVLAAVGVFSVINTLSVFGQVSDKSIPLASDVRGYFDLIEAGEPTAVDGRPIQISLSNKLTADVYRRLIRAGDGDTLRASDIYHEATVPAPLIDELRGHLRMYVQASGIIKGGWPRLGVPGAEGCRAIEPGQTFPVKRKVVMRLERGEPGDVVLTWVDEWGVGTITIDESAWDAGGESVYVNLLDPGDDAPNPSLTIDGAPVVVCLL